MNCLGFMLRLLRYHQCWIYQFYLQNVGTIIIDILPYVIRLGHNKVYCRAHHRLESGLIVYKRPNNNDLLIKTKKVLRTEGDFMSHYLKSVKSHFTPVHSYFTTWRWSTSSCLILCKFTSSTVLPGSNPVITAHVFSLCGSLGAALFSCQDNKVEMLFSNPLIQFPVEMRLPFLAE